MMQPLPVRIPPGEDLREALDRVLAAHGCDAAFVVAGVGSLATTRLRLAGADEPTALDGAVEILTLAGSVSPAGSHLHVSVADAAGRVTGGHVARGCVVRTTAEVLLVLLPEWSMNRVTDSVTGPAELVVQPKR
jgi:predicted DNA-binding protein with PD1-like motif